jgi:3-oxoadipate enol-lactonase
MNKNSIDLSFSELGQGMPVIFLHGFPLDHTTWLPVSKLIQTKFRCILPDLRGLGKSPVVGTETTIKIMAEDVTRLMDKLEISQAVIAGHSMGGYVAMQLAHSFPDRVNGLVLIATRADADEPDKAAARLLSRENVLKNGSAELVENMASRLTDDPVLEADLRKVMEKTNPQGMAMAQFAMANREDATPWLSKITLPIVVVAGEKDVIIPIDSMRNLAQRLSCGKFYFSPTATHMIPMEAPELLARALEETYLDR